jgi:Zn-dependent peptidase ImmA (M78 family)
MINTLQRLVPRRPLDRLEMLAIAEQQAQRLRRLLGIDDAHITTDQLQSIPGILINEVARLGVSGATRLVGDLWVILVNRDEAPVRRRFTIAHEIKHILDDEAVAHLRKAGGGEAPSWLTERVCDYFAACLLMPRMWVKRAWTTTTQNESDLAALFNVSADAIRIRLRQIGLVEPTERCRGYVADVVPLPARNAI